MSLQLSNTLRAVGVADVIVYLKSDSKRKGLPGPIEKLFLESELSHRSALRAAAGSRKRRGRVRYFPNLGIALGTVDRRGLVALKSESKDVQSVSGVPQISLIRPVGMALRASAPRRTWGIESLHVPELWKAGLTGKGIRVGHLDTGVDGKHPALRGAIAKFAEFDDLGFEVTPRPAPYDTDDHGTHTAGTIAGRSIGGRSIGVAPGCKLYSAIVIEGGDVVARVLAGMDWAVGQGVRILNMSLGFRGWWDDFLQLTRILRRNNILPVFAVGNEGPGTSRSPGNYADALSVGAIDRRWHVASFSSSQRFSRSRDPIVPDLVAPGVATISCKPGGGYQSLDGTSMATPHMAGLAALLWQARPDASVFEVEKAIFESCRRPVGMNRDRGNRGIPDGRKALQVLLTL